MGEHRDGIFITATKSTDGKKFKSRFKISPNVLNEGCVGKGEAYDDHLLHF